ncbi:hypothetical protein MIR68_000341 [Amoeboaphelidium protococcarum]|nr:hypothetical protein MIR68_000341 [Amoeboaphelidium protococcarum]
MNKFVNGQRTDVDTNESGIVAPLSVHMSPRSMAARRNEMEHEYHTVNEAFAIKITKLRNQIEVMAQQGDATDNSAMLQQMEKELQKSGEQFQRDKSAAAESLDLKIARAQDDENRQLNHWCIDVQAFNHRNGYKTDS